MPAVRYRLAAETETETAVRAELLNGYARLDRAGAVVGARVLLDPDAPVPLRLAAVFTVLDAGEPWPAAHRDTALSLLPPCETAGSGHADEHREPPGRSFGIRQVAGRP